MSDLHEIPTRDLVEELSRRTCVQTEIVTHTARVKIEAEGPSIILTVRGE